MNFPNAFDMIDYIDKKIKIWLKNDIYSKGACDDLITLDDDLSCDQIDNSLSIWVDGSEVSLEVCVVVDEDGLKRDVAVCANCINGLWRVVFLGFSDEKLVVESQDINELSSSFVMVYKAAKTLRDEMLESKKNCLNKIMAKDHLVIWDKGKK